MMLEEGMQPGLWGDVEHFGGNIVLKEVEQERTTMLQLANRGHWASVLKILGGNSIAAGGLPMNNVEDSILHLAASDGQTEVVRKLLGLIKDNEDVGPAIGLLGEEPANITRNANEAANITGNTPLHLAADMGHEETCKCIVDMVPRLVKARNAYGNTPLHLAAAMGLEDTCKRMAELFPELAKARNADGETPIFMAALGGHKRVFITLTTMFLHVREIALARRNDGDTLLHCAISGEYFDLASAIIEKYERLIHCRNDRGLTPLHLLANNPSAFRSGCQLNLIEYFLYSSIKVSTESKSDDLKHQKQEECTFKLRGNYLLCWSFFNLWRNILATIGGFMRCITEIREKKHKHRWAEKVMVLFRWITEMREKKEKHKWAEKMITQLLTKIDRWAKFREIYAGMDPRKYLLESTREIGATMREEEIRPPLTEENEIASEPVRSDMQESQPTRTTGSKSQEPKTLSNQQKEDSKRGMIESPFLIAGKKGVKEMVEEILKRFPIAIHDMDLEHKNIMLLAAEHRQPEIFNIVLRRQKVSLHGKVDVEGNSVLHLAAKYPQKQQLLIPGAVLQMQREIKWFRYVKDRMPTHFSKRLNHDGKTAMEVFTDTHQELALQRAKWLGKASQSCSVVATLITTVAFATISSVPGGLRQGASKKIDWTVNDGIPVFRAKLAFSVFSVSSLLAFFFSATSLIMCLGVLTSPYKDLDFGNDLAKKLIGGLFSLFLSIATMFLSFFSGDLFVLEHKMSYIAYATLAPASFVAATGFLLYIEFIRQTINPVPKRTYPHKLL